MRPLCGSADRRAPDPIRLARAAAELDNLDLIIGALLGHAKKGITGRYATAPDPALVAAADKISMALARALDGKPANKK